MCRVEALRAAPPITTRCSRQRYDRIREFQKVAGTLRACERMGIDCERLP